MTQKGIDAMDTSTSPLFSKPGGGYSAVFGPDGRRFSEPIPPDQEGIVYADLPMDLLVTMRSFVDCVGHYSRPDLLWLGVDKREKKHVRSENDSVDVGKSESEGKVNGEKKV